MWFKIEKITMNKEILQEISQSIYNIAPWAKPILYGSEARGESSKDSDIDILILVPDTMQKDFNAIKSKIQDELYLLELKHDKFISPLILLQNTWNQRKTPFTLNVEKDGISL